MKIRALHSDQTDVKGEENRFICFSSVSSLICLMMSIYMDRIHFRLNRSKAMMIRMIGTVKYALFTLSLTLYFSFAPYHFHQTNNPIRKFVVFQPFPTKRIKRKKQTRAEIIRYDFHLHFNRTDFEEDAWLNLQIVELISPWNGFSSSVSKGFSKSNFQIQCFSFRLFVWCSEMFCFFLSFWRLFVWFGSFLNLSTK